MHVPTGDSRFRHPLFCPTWVGAFFALCLLGCASQPDRKKAADDNPVVIQTPNAEVHLDEFLFYFQKNYPELESETDDDLWSYIFEKFRRDIFIGEISQALGFRVTNDQIDHFIKYSMTGMSYHNLPPEQQLLWRKAIKRRLAIQEFLNREILETTTISDQAIAQYYEQNQDQFQRETVYRLRFLKLTNQEKAEAFLSAIKTSKASFTEVAAEFAENEGYQLIVPLTLEAMLTPFQNEVNKLKPGHHSPIIAVNPSEEASFYVLFLESIVKPLQISYEEAYDYIRDELAKRTCRKLLDEKLNQFELLIPLTVFGDQLPFKYTPTNRKEV